jgi:hypothetical protein
MKLAKSKLLKITKDKLTELGYQEFKDTQTGASGLFIKLINEDYYLTLGLTISRFYNTRFTASYYLSKTTRWSAVWGDIPKESYQRIGHFLTKEERQLLLDEEHNKEGVTDAWWSSNDEQEISKFFRTIELTEKRFLNQKNLFSKIESSSEVIKLVSYSFRVIALVTEGKTPEQYEYQFTPNKPIDDVPLIWFKAAEISLIDQGGILNQNTVKLLAVDAWRQYKFKQG